MTKLVHFDWAIKNLLRNKANFDILEGFLSELLQTKVTIDESHYGRGKLDGKDECKIEIAINMLNDNEPLKKIIRFTGLSHDDLLTLKKNRIEPIIKRDLVRSYKNQPLGDLLQII